MSVDRNKGIFRWVGFLWLLIHRAKASECFCTLGDSSTPVHSQPNAVSETVGFMESKTCFHGNFVPGMQWLQVHKTDIFMSKDSLTACPDGLVKTITAFKKTKDFKTLKTEKTTNSRLRDEERRFVLDSLNQAQCDFEVNSFCSWRNIQGGHDDFDWVLYQSSTPTDDTGPTFDHTLNNATGTYIFIESSAPRSTNDTAWIQSPQIDAKNVPVHCFRFWYHMYGSSIDGLKVYQVTNGSLPGNLVWSLTGEQGSTWMEGQVPLSSNHSYSMLISGIVGNGYQGDIAIDDVSVSPGYCDVKPSNASRTDVKNTVSGIWSSWSNYTECTVTCGGGTRARLRMCVYTPGFPHGDPCVGHNNETQQCNTDLCPDTAVRTTAAPHLDGGWSEWSLWSVCDATCANGQHVRYRNCENPRPQNFGKFCEGDDNDVATCFVKPCPIDGGFGDWLAWGSCVPPTGIGLKTRTRVCDKPQPLYGGKNCQGNYTEELPCCDSDCPVDGGWSQWSAWSDCLADSNANTTKSRTRSCSQPAPLYGGHNCTGESEESACCQVNGGWTSWYAWSVCVGDCATANRDRNRQCSNPRQSCGGKYCVGVGHELDNTCIPDNCTTIATATMTTSTSAGIPDTTAAATTITGAISAAATTVTTIGATQLLTSTSPLTAGSSQTGTSSATNGPPTSSTSSTATSTTDSIIIITPQTTTGSSQTGTSSDVTSPAQQFNITTTSTTGSSNDVNVDGAWGQWADWSVCNCNNTQTRVRKCDSPAPIGSGQQCPGSSRDTMRCTDKPTTCPVDGQWGSWYPWSVCSTTCGSGEMLRLRACNNPRPLNGGLYCDSHEKAEEERMVCQGKPCPINGSWSIWDMWATCSVTCGIGSHSRNRTCDHPAPEHGGEDCAGTGSENRNCTMNPCPVDGSWSGWSAWSACDVTCATGTRERARTCDSPAPKHGGQTCNGTDDQFEQCQEKPCPVDGVWHSWSAWSACTVTCGNGTSSRDRVCDFPANTPQGRYCIGSNSESHSCNAVLCPVAVDGHWSDWTQWSSCSVTCATGNITRSRTCSNPSPVNGGQQCNGLSADSDACNLPKCPMWSSWFSDTCSVTCGQGQQARVRHCSTGNFADCAGPAFENATCHALPCAVDGHWSEWSTWSQCDVTCASGNSHRTRNCSNPKPLYGGSDCQGVSVDTTACILQTCPTWSRWFTGECSVTCGRGSASLLRMCSTGKDSDCSGTPFDSVACNKPAC